MFVDEPQELASGRGLSYAGCLLPFCRSFGNPVILLGDLQ